MIQVDISDLLPDEHLTVNEDENWLTLVLKKGENTVRTDMSMYRVRLCSEQGFDLVAERVKSMLQFLREETV